MIFKYARVTAMIILVGVMLTAPAGAETLDNVLGIPWGSSIEQTSQLMTKHNFSFSKIVPDPTGSLIKSFKGGMYAGYPAYIHVYFMDDQMWKLSVTSWEDDIGHQLQFAFDNLYKLLTQKYGPKSHDLPTYEEKPLWTGYIWSLHGNTKKITLSMTPTSYFSDATGNHKWTAG